MNYYSNQYKDIIGRKFQKVVFDEKNVTFLSSDPSLKDVTYYCEGDCCSSSFIESIDDEEVFKDATILEVNEESGESKDVGDCDVHRWTFVKFKTDKGYATLSFRNESNGYYDGYLELMI